MHAAIGLWVPEPAFRILSGSCPPRAVWTSIKKCSLSARTSSRILMSRYWQTHSSAIQGKAGAVSSDIEPVSSEAVF